MAVTVSHGGLCCASVKLTAHCCSGAYPSGATLYCCMDANCKKRLIDRSAVCLLYGIPQQCHISLSLATWHTAAAPRCNAASMPAVDKDTMTRQPYARHIAHLPMYCLLPVPHTAHPCDIKICCCINASCCQGHSDMSSTWHTILHVAPALFPAHDPPQL